MSWLMVGSIKPWFRQQGDVLYKMYIPVYHYITVEKFKQEKYGHISSNCSMPYRCGLPHGSGNYTIPVKEASTD